MVSERENISLPRFGILRLESYLIDGNDIRAYYDAAGKLVFVIDSTITGDKPNALLVINPVGDRKWDDILSNDYGVALEMVRPKKNNKYQKLDIEYSGLAEYDNLIQDYQANRDIGTAIDALARFRLMAVRKSAAVRVDMADATAQTARETIQKTKDTIAELSARIKTLRAKLAQQKKAVGKEPTKQSAAKILRTESQIDATNEKLRRAQRRLNNAQRRLAAAEEDAAAARKILDAHSDIVIAAPREVAVVQQPVVAHEDTPKLVSAPVFTDFIVSDERTDDKEDSKSAPQADALPVAAANLLPEPKANEMAEEVKPLFNKDPEILDEEIAFKPIDFGTVPVPSAPSQHADTNLARTYPEENAPAPLSFVPPSAVATEDNFDRPVMAQDVADTVPQAAPVLDTLTSVAQPRSVPAPQNEASFPEVAVPQSFGTTADTDFEMSRPAAPAMPSNSSVGAAMRPVSPVYGAVPKPVSGSNGGVDNRGKPSFLYYLMLIMLIVLSIFTLWLYQKKSNDNVPDLAATVSQNVPDDSADNLDGPFLGDDTEIVEVIEEPVVVPEPVIAEAAPEPEPIVPVVDENVPLVPVVVEDAPEIEEPVVEVPFVAVPEPEPVKEPVVNKPVYNAGAQNENMFVASPDYETESTTIVDMYDQPVAPSYQVAAPDVIVEEAVTQETWPMCEDGMLADENGCCGGEVFTDSQEGFVCCSEQTGECFKPLF